MKLKEIAVQGLFGEYDCSLSLNESGITFLHSLNGTGKSTLLRMVNAVFNNDKRTLEDIPFRKMSLSFYEGTIVSVMKNPNLDFVISTKEFDDRVNQSEVSGLFDILYISAERTIIVKDDKMYPAMDEYLKEFNKMFAEAKNDNELKEPKNLINVDEDRFVNLCQNLKAKLDYIAETGLTVKLPADIKFPPNRYEFTQNKDRYISVVSSLSEWIDGKYRLAESIAIYLDVVNNLFRNKRVFIDDRNNVHITIDNKTHVLASSLSAGEKQILIMFHRVLFHAKDNSMVFIDEPEISLHVSWQQALGPVLQDICRVRGLQMLIATHSPQIIHDKWDLATELRSGRA